ncbi:MAG: hypothetical protein WBC60_14615 [Cognaticolwellia sp.]
MSGIKANIIQCCGKKFIGRWARIVVIRARIVKTLIVIHSTLAKNISCGRISTDAVYKNKKKKARVEFFSSILGKWFAIKNIPSYVTVNIEYYLLKNELKLVVAGSIKQQPSSIEL